MSFREFLLEARGVFHIDKIGTSLIYKGIVYTIEDIGRIEDWDSFKLNNRVVQDTKSNGTSYYVRVSNGTDTYCLVSGSNSGISVNRFLGWSGMTTSKTAVLNIKPQSFDGISDKWLSIKELESRLFSSIDKRSDLDEQTKIFLKSSFSSITSGAKIEFYDTVSGNKNAIIKDYGEILGGIWYLKQRNSLSNGKIYLPEAGNYPLIDLLLKVGDTELKISAKSGNGVSNTVKGKDIFNVLSNLSSDKMKKVKQNYGKELEMLSAIDKHNTVVGTVKAFSIIQPTVYKSYKKAIDLIMNTPFKKMLDQPTDDKLVEHLLSLVSLNMSRVKGSVYSQNGVLMLMSKVIESHSKSMKFVQLSNDILSDNIIYIKAKSIDNSGNITFTYTTNDTVFTKGYLRYKGSLNRSSDKLGLQIDF